MMKVVVMQTVMQNLPWFEVKRCSITNETVPMHGLLFNKDNGETWAVENNDGKLWQLHQFTPHEDDTPIDRNKAYMLGGEYRKTKFREKLMVTVGRCRRGDKFKSFFSFNYPHRYGLILHDSEDPKMLYYRNCEDEEILSNRSSSAANQVPMYDVCGLKKFESLDADSPSINLTFMLIYRDMKYLIYYNKFYEIYDKDRLIGTYQIPVVEKCEREYEPFSINCTKVRPSPGSGAPLSRVLPNGCYFKLLSVIIFFIHPFGY